MYDCKGSLTAQQMNSIRKAKARTKPRGLAIRPAKHGRREGRAVSK